MYNIYVILKHLLGKCGHCNDYYGWMDSGRMGITLRTEKYTLYPVYVRPINCERKETYYQCII